MIKNAITYSIEMPKAAAMDEFITGSVEQIDLFVASKPVDSQLFSCGFVRHPVTGDVVAQFKGGYCLTFRQYEKKIDKQALNEKINDIATAREQETGTKLKRAERLNIKDDIIQLMTPHILPTPKTVFVYFNEDTNTLIVDTTVDSVADRITSILRKCIGSLKATTLYIDQAAGLTSKLVQQLIVVEDGKNQFFIPGITIGHSVELKGMEGELIKFKGVDLFYDGTADEIADNITEGGMFVKSIDLEVPGTDTTFTLTDGCKFKNFKFYFEHDDLSTEDAIEQWETETWYCVNQVTSITHAVVDAFTVVDNAE